MKRWNLGRVGHPKKGQPYHEVNCPRGVEHFADLGYPWVDLDGNPFKSLYRKYVTGNTHWFRPLLRDGFRDPLDEIGKPRTTASILVDEMRRLVTPGGHRIFQMTYMFRVAADARINVLEELKYHRAFESVELHRHEQWHVEQLQQTRPHFQVIVAILSTHPRAVFVAKAAKKAGRETCLLAHSDYPAPWREHFDYVRGTGKAVPVR